jgi:hypothetical protein
MERKIKDNGYIKIHYVAKILKDDTLFEKGKKKWIVDKIEKSEKYYERECDPMYKTMYWLHK